MRAGERSDATSGSVIEARRPLGIVLVEAASVTAFAVLLAPLLVPLAGGLVTPAAWAAAAIGATLGYLVADVASGLVHWFCDRFLEEDTRVIGPLLIFPFRDHHRDPGAMTRHGWLELTGNSCLATSPLLALASVWPLAVGVDAALLAFALAGLMTNLFHCWGHAPRVPRLVTRFQAWGLVLRPRDHAVHHSPGNRGAYCVTSGWANRGLDGLGIFARLERALVAVGVPATRQA